MDKRLRLAKNLLKTDGIICITIDNHELHNLLHILTDIFFNKEIITTVIEHNLRGKRGNNFALTHEYAIWILNGNKDLITKLPEIGSDVRRNLRKTGGDPNRSDSPSMFYGIEVNKKTLEIVNVTFPLSLNEKIPKHKNPKTEMIWPIDSEGNEKRWYYGHRRILKSAKIKEVYAKKIKNIIQIHYYISGKPIRRKSIWTGPKYDASTYGTELLTEIIGENDFPYPKSIHAVKDCISSMNNNKNAVILDFFAGSGTTGHAVLELNKEDNGNRQFILCTNNENKICTEICYPRIKKVIKGYSFNGTYKKCLYEQKFTMTVLKNIDLIFEKINEIQNKKEYDDFEIKIEYQNIKLYGKMYINDKKDSLEGNLKYFKTDFIDWDHHTKQNKKKLVEQSTEMLCLKENCFELVKSSSKFKVFKNNQKWLGVVYHRTGVEPFKIWLKSNKSTTKINTYVFPPKDEVNDDEFHDVIKSVNLKPIPSVILNVYRRIFDHV